MFRDLSTGFFNFAMKLITTNSEIERKEQIKERNKKIQTNYQ